MKNALKETVDAILSVLKDCCPTLKNNNYHIKSWHQDETHTDNLLYETDNIICALCKCNHLIERCPCARVLSK